MRGELFPHHLSNIVLGRKVRTDMDAADPVATGATVAGLWVPAQQWSGICHIAAIEESHISARIASQFFPIAAFHEPTFAL